MTSEPGEVVPSAARFSPVSRGGERRFHAPPSRRAGRYYRCGTARCHRGPARLIQAAAQVHTAARDGPAGGPSLPPNQIVLAHGGLRAPKKVWAGRRIFAPGRKNHSRFAPAAPLPSGRQCFISDTQLPSVQRGSPYLLVNSFQWDAAAYIPSLPAHQQAGRIETGSFLPGRHKASVAVGAAARS